MWAKPQPNGAVAVLLLNGGGAGLKTPMHATVSSATLCTGAFAGTGRRTCVGVHGSCTCMKPKPRCGTFTCTGPCPTISSSTAKCTLTPSTHPHHTHTHTHTHTLHTHMHTHARRCHCHVVQPYRSRWRRSGSRKAQWLCVTFGHARTWAALLPTRLRRHQWAQGIAAFTCLRQCRSCSRSGIAYTDRLLFLYRHGTQQLYPLDTHIHTQRDRQTSAGIGHRKTLAARRHCVDHSRDHSLATCNAITQRMQYLPPSTLPYSPVVAACCTCYCMTSITAGTNTQHKLS